MIPRVIRIVVDFFTTFKTIALKNRSFFRSSDIFVWRGGWRRWLYQRQKEIKKKKPKTKKTQLLLKQSGEKQTYYVYNTLISSLIKFIDKYLANENI